jgi:hypothetical protein
MESGLWIDGISYKCQMGEAYTRSLTDFKKFELNSSEIPIKYIPKDTAYYLIERTKIKMESGLWIDGISYKCQMGEVHTRSLTNFKKFELK